jgi:putative transposase
MGRKRHILVDMMGWLLAVCITPASVQDRDGAQLLLAGVRDRLPRVTTIFADGGYAGQLVAWVETMCGWLLSIVKRTSAGFEILPKRWIVERTFAWLTRYRRTARDYELRPDTVEAMTYAAMVHLMIRRFAKQQRALPVVT